MKQVAVRWWHGIEPLHRVTVCRINRAKVVYYLMNFYMKGFFFPLSVLKCTARGSRLDSNENTTRFSASEKCGVDRGCAQPGRTVGVWTESKAAVKVAWQEFLTRTQMHSSPSCRDSCIAQSRSEITWHRFHMWFSGPGEPGSSDFFRGGKPSAFGRSEQLWGFEQWYSGYKVHF